MDTRLVVARLVSFSRCLFLLALGVRFVSCSPTTFDHMVVVVDTANITPDIVKIETNAILNGVPAMQGMDITSPLSQFAVEIPYGDKSMGTLLIRLTAYSADGCKTAEGEAAVMLVPGQYQYEVSANLMALPTRLCTLTVNVNGAGVVSSGPPGINCGKTCTADFPIGSTVSLSAMPTPQNSAGAWGGACAGSAMNTCAVSMNMPQTVGATFPPNCFGTAKIYGVGDNPTWIATADFNSDGILDLVNLNHAGGTLEILIGDGKGGFTIAASSPINVGGGSFQATLGDFNGDMKQDLAIVYGTPSSIVKILLGNGLGGFTASNISTAAQGPTCITARDFNNDTKVDLAFTDFPTGKLYVLLGNGMGGFNIQPTISVGNHPTGVEVGDFNGDLKHDLAVVNQADNSVSILLGNGAGGFTVNSTTPVGVSPWISVLGDFNQDGKLDIAAAMGGQGDVNVLLGNGAGGVTQKKFTPVGNGPAPLAIGDWNGDAKLDLLVANENDNSVSVLIGDGTGFFTPAANTPLAAGKLPVAITVADWNGDMLPDIAVNHGADSTVRVWLHLPTGNLPCQ